MAGKHMHQLLSIDPTSISQRIQMHTSCIPAFHHDGDGDDNGDGD
jgi:hypothetical protein